MSTTTHHTTLSLRSYVIGFTSSLVLTVAAYLLVTERWLDDGYLIAAIASLALAQLVVQLICFLHLGKEPGAKWQLVVFLFMIVVVLIVVVGSLWIMNNLNYNMMHDMQTMMQLENQKGF